MKRKGHRRNGKKKGKRQECFPDLIENSDSEGEEEEEEEENNDSDSESGSIVRNRLERVQGTYF